MAGKAKSVHLPPLDQLHVEGLVRLVSARHPELDALIGCRDVDDELFVSVLELLSSSPFIRDAMDSRDIAAFLSAFAKHMEAHTSTDVAGFTNDILFLLATYRRVVADMTPLEYGLSLSAISCLARTPATLRAADKVVAYAAEMRQNDDSFLYRLKAWGASKISRAYKAIYSGQLLPDACEQLLAMLWCMYPDATATPGTNEARLSSHHCSTALELATVPIPEGVVAAWCVDGCAPFVAPSSYSCHAREKVACAEPGSSLLQEICYAASEAALAEVAAASEVRGPSLELKMQDRDLLPWFIDISKPSGSFALTVFDEFIQSYDECSDSEDPVNISFEVSCETEPYIDILAIVETLVLGVVQDQVDFPVKCSVDGPGLYSLMFPRVDACDWSVRITLRPSSSDVHPMEDLAEAIIPFKRNLTPSVIAIHGISCALPEGDRSKLREGDAASTVASQASGTDFHPSRTSSEIGVWEPKSSSIFDVH